MLTMKFRQLIEYNLRNIFLEKFTKQAGETSHRLFPQISKLSITLGQQSKSFIQFGFVLCSSRGLSKYIETKM